MRSAWVIAGLGLALGAGALSSSGCKKAEGATLHGAIEHAGHRVSWSLSYEGVEYELVEHALTPEQVRELGHHWEADGWRSALGGASFAFTLPRYEEDEVGHH